MKETVRFITQIILIMLMKKEWYFMRTLTQTDTNRKTLIQKMQQLLDKLPLGEERKALRKKLLKLKLGK